MTAYCYDRETGAYTGPVTPHLDPLETEAQGHPVYMLPAWATELEPPVAEAGKVAVFADGAWTLLADHRGEFWFTADGQKVEVIGLGDPVASGLQPTEPPRVLTKDELKAYAAAKRYAVETGGVTVGQARIDTTRESQSLIGNAVLLSLYTAPEAVVKFKSLSGWVTLPKDALVTIGKAVGDHVQASFAAEEAVDSAIEVGTITDKAGVDAANWPG